MVSSIRLAAVAIAAFAACQHPVLAQEYPSRPVTLIVPWAAGGAVDTHARIVAPKLSERLGKAVIVENRPGGGSTIGTALGAKAAPDGHTLGMPGSGSLAISPSMYKSLPYDPVKDFSPIALVGGVPFVLIVNKDLPINTVPELVAYAKTNKLNYGSGGAGSPHHLYGELLKMMTGIEMTHVPYKGSADAIKDVVAGHVQLMFSDTAPSVPLIRAGAVKVLGLSTTVRLVNAPEIVPLHEMGVPGFDAAGWFMISGPVGTPKPIVDRLHSELRAILGMADVREQINRTGVVPVVSPPLGELTPFVEKERARWSKVVQQAGLAGSQ